MENTIELIRKQNEALVQVIHFLDSHNYSDHPVRDVVDRILNHSDDLIEYSTMELTKIRLVK